MAAARPLTQDIHLAGRRTLSTTIFHYGTTDVRAVLIDGEPWFVAADVCAILEISNPSMAVARLDDDESTLISTEGRYVNVVSEAGLFALILGSRKPEARAFKRWVTHEVLPSIRRTGSYSTTPALPQTYAAALRELAATVERFEALEAAIAELMPRAEAWDELASAGGITRSRMRRRSLPALG